MDCPRCGAPMSGGVCPECGFPITGIKMEMLFAYVQRNEKV